MPTNRYINNQAEKVLDSRARTGLRATSAISDAYCQLAWFTLERRGLQRRFANASFETFLFRKQRLALLL